MKRILLLAAGAIGTAGMIALAAPASAHTTPEIQLDKLGNSEVANTFLYGNCNGEQVCPKQGDEPAEVSHPGILNQFKFFGENLAGQQATFQKSIESFVKGIPTPPAAAKPATTP